jgi:hypothetical protein
LSSIADDDEIDLVVDSIQNRCATVRRIEHIGINAYYVYLKFSSKEAAAQGFHLLNNWKYHGNPSLSLEKISFISSSFRSRNHCQIPSSRTLS